MKKETRARLGNLAQRELERFELEREFKVSLCRGEMPVAYLDATSLPPQQREDRYLARQLWRWRVEEGGSARSFAELLAEYKGRALMEEGWEYEPVLHERQAREAVAALDEWRQRQNWPSMADIISAMEKARDAACLAAYRAEKAKAEAEAAKAAEAAKKSPRPRKRANRPFTLPLVEVANISAEVLRKIGEDNDKDKENSGPSY